MWLNHQLAIEAKINKAASQSPTQHLAGVLLINHDTRNEPSRHDIG